MNKNYNLVLLKLEVNMRKISYILILLLISIVSGNTQPNGEMHISIGGIYPQGNYTAYADPGVTANLRWTVHMNQFGFLSGWLNINGSFFSSEEFYVELLDDPYYRGADERISEYAISLHTGLQIGSDSRQGAIRPRLAFGPGIYFFNTEDKLTIPGLEEPYDINNETQVKFGWRAFAGLDLFVNSRWGFTFDFTYDHVLSLDHIWQVESADKIVKIGQTARFNSYSAGVVLSF
jgi:hypothetical protein